MIAFQLSQCRGAARTLYTGFLLTAALGLIVSVLQVHASMGGMRPTDVADAIAGPAPRGDATTAEDDLFAAGADGEGKSYGSMLQTAHTHTLAIPMLYVLLGAVFLGTSLTDRTKSRILALTFLAITLDLGGLWLMRYVDRQFVYWTITTGTAMFLFGAVLIGQSLWDLWITSPTTRTESSP